ncbi:MAG: DUF6282 family protein [Candidatus Saccharimonadales bacterium]
MNQITDIVRRSIDMHVHIGPEIIPRRYTAQTLLAEESGNLAGAVLKNHFYPTVPFAVSNAQMNEYGAIVLNWSVGGLNPEAVRAMSLISPGKFVVWLPTIHAANFLEQSEFEIAPEWCSGVDMQPRLASEVAGIRVTDDAGVLSLEATAVVDAIAEAGAVLATGHVSVEETVAVARYARKKSVPVVLTHPIYQRINMPVDTQQELASLGCYIEVCYSMYSIDGIALDRLAEQIQSIGPEQVILSSDVGQMKSVSPSEALVDFATLLVNRGIPVKWIEKMLVDNPKKLLEGKR